MLWEVEIHPAAGETDREALRILAESKELGTRSVSLVLSARSYLIEGSLDRTAVEGPVVRLLSDGLVEEAHIHELPDHGAMPTPERLRGVGSSRLLNVLLKPGVTDNVANTAAEALRQLNLDVTRVATSRKYWINADATDVDVNRLCGRVLANDSIEHVVHGPLQTRSLAIGSGYEFELLRVKLHEMDDDGLMQLSAQGQLYLSLVEMQTIRSYFRDLGRDPTDIELETLAQTWSEHCSHKTLAGRIAYQDESGERRFENMLKETIFAATQTIRARAGADDWCVSVFRDNAGIVRFDEEYDVCFKVETHNHPSALEPYGGANTGIGGVIRDPLGTGLGAKPLCNTDVFCFAPPETEYAVLPPGVLHPRKVMNGVVAGVRDYGNRMGIPTVNGAVFFDDRYIGNPLVFCGNVALIPRGMSEKRVVPNDLIVSIGGRTGRDGIHGATFSSAELTHKSEELSGGAVQIGNAITEKMLMDVILQARDRRLYHAITDCGAGGFSSAVGEMAADTGAEVWLEQAPLKYSGLSYTEIWISEAQERMVLAVPEENWQAFRELCQAEGVEATIIGRFTDSRRLVLTYQGHEVGNLDLEFLHDGRPPVVRQAHYVSARLESTDIADAVRAQTASDAGEVLKGILSSLNVCSKEWIIRQYDHEVQGGSVIKPLVGVANDGPSDAAVIRPALHSRRGLVVSCGMNPCYGDLDPYWMAASAIDEAVRNCIAVGATPSRIAILDNFCWGNTERPETLGALVRAAIGCHDTAIAYGTPFISGKDSLNNEFSYIDAENNKRTVAIPPSLLISALGQVSDVERCVTMDLKSAGNILFQVGTTKAELGGSHYHLTQSLTGGSVPHVDFEHAPCVFEAIHKAISDGVVRSCHDLSEGGLAVAVAEMAFAGGLGVEISLAEFGKMDDVVVLFSESNTRFVVEVPAVDADRFVEIIRGHCGQPVFRLGDVNNSRRVRVTNLEGRNLINESIDDLKDCWQRPLAHLSG